MRKSLATIALIASVGQASAQSAENPPTLWSMMTVERFGTAIMNQMMIYARVLADIRYDSMQVDAIGATVRLVGLEVVPKIPGLAPEACVIRADRATVRGAPLDQVDTTRIRMTLDNALVDFDCFPAEIRPMIGLMGVNDLHIDRLDIAASYHFPTGGAQVQFQAGIDGLLRVLGDADIDYVSYRMNFDTEEAEPAVLLNSARIQIEDRGLTARSQQILPPDLRDADRLADTVRGTLDAALRGPTGLVGPAQQQFIDDAAAMAKTLSEGGKRIVIETNIAKPPLRLDEKNAQDPDALFEALMPRIAAAPLALDATLPLSQLQAAQDGDLEGDTALAAGRALISGNGAPRNVALALEVLKPLADDGVAEASFLMAQALSPREPAVAYSHALSAAAAGHGPALALLDGIENTLSFRAVIDGQKASLPEDLVKPDVYGSIGDIRAAALDHMIGIGLPRSYVAAYFWASVAAAAGDTASDALRHELNERMRVRGLAAEWAVVTDEIEARVLDAWVSADMPARLKSQ